MCCPNYSNGIKRFLVAKMKKSIQILFSSADSNINRTLAHSHYLQYIITSMQSQLNFDFSFTFRVFFQMQTFQEWFMLILRTLKYNR